MGHHRTRHPTRGREPSLSAPVIEDVLEVQVGAHCFIAEVGRLPGALESPATWQFAGPCEGDRWALDQPRAARLRPGQHWYAVAYIPGTAGPCSLAIKKAPDRSGAIQGIHRMLREFCQKQRPQADAAALADADERLDSRPLGSC